MSKLLIVLLVTFSHNLLVCAQDSKVSKSSAKENDEQKQTSSQKTSKDDQSALIVRGVKLPANQTPLNLDVISDQPEKFSGKQVCVEGSISVEGNAHRQWRALRD